jgi:DNA-binding CsgD family transcriptional regulator
VASVRVGALLERCGRLRTPALTAMRPVLTAREHQVAALAAADMSNGEIAEHLGTSVRTVGNQLQRVYDKLGIHTRAQLRAVFDL